MAKKIKKAGPLTRFGRMTPEEAVAKYSPGFYVVGNRLFTTTYTGSARPFVPRPVKA